ncbi:MAG: glycosyltransferase family 39 protein, partial [Leptospiraceae bacterium]|nr:glycosyltransferase family 39 protein [Leptospiraceae bacterium]
MKYKLLLLLFAVLPVLFTLPLDVIDIDTAQYAEISREMVVTGDYIHLQDNGKKYLDKPILTFWTIALFYKAFGINEVSFRLSAIFVLLLTAFILYKLSVLIYENETIGFYAAIIYLSLPGVFSIVLNPLIDIYLCLYLALIHYTYYLGVKRNPNWYYLMYWFIGMGFITKGPVAAIIPALSIGGDIFLRRDWERLKDLKLGLGIPIACFLPLVWSYLLLEEYSWYGPYFFLWQQSFGRFYDKIYNQAFNPPYFYATFFWGIFPLSGFLLYIIYKYIKNFFQKKEKFYEKINIFFKEASDKDFVILFWVFLFLFFISFSRYQLPQYTYWTLPGASIFLAYAWSKDLPKKDSLKRNLLIYFPSSLAIAVLLIIPFQIVDVSWKYWFVVIGSFVLGYWIYNRTQESLLINLFPLQIVFLVISLFVYPELLKYQPSKELGKLIQ